MTDRPTLPDDFTVLVVPIGVARSVTDFLRHTHGLVFGQAAPALGLPDGTHVATPDPDHLASLTRASRTLVVTEPARGYAAVPVIGRPS